MSPRSNASFQFDAALGRMAHDEQERLVVVREHHRCRSRRQDLAEVAHGAALVDYPPAVETPLDRDPELRQRLLEHRPPTLPARGEHDVGDPARQGARVDPHALGNHAEPAQDLTGRRL